MMNHVVVAIALCLFITGCSDGANFNASNASGKDRDGTWEHLADQDLSSQPLGAQSDWDADIAVSWPKEAGTEVFSLTKLSGLLDIIWVIDNSLSMTDDIEQVALNLEMFIQSLETISDVSLSILSGGCDPEDVEGMTGVSGCRGNGIHISDEMKAKGHMQQELDVESTNALAVFGSAICDLDDPEKICQDALEEASRGLGSLDPELVPGYLVERLRKNSTKVLVVVTDDNARTLNAAATAALVKKKNLGPLTYFSFQGIESSSCDVEKVGVEYQVLNDASGGQAFDICALDWSANFSKLTANIKEIVQRKFTLAADAVRIKSVHIDGNALAADRYKQTAPNVVELDRDVLQDGREVTIVYVPKV